jgi:hypothetical protein
MMPFRSRNAVIVFALLGLTVPPLLEAQTLEQRVKDLEKRVAALEAKIATCQCGSTPAEVSWETNDITDNPMTQKQSKTLPFAPKSAVVSLFEIRNIGGGGGPSAPISPARTVTLLQGASGDIPMSECFVIGGGGIWQLKLDGSTLTMTSLKCGYPKGFRGAFKIVLTP